MINLSYEDVMGSCIAEAVNIALEEARATMLVPGAHVGHVDLEKYGPNWATLLSITETECSVEFKDGSTSTWPREGTVDVDRVDDLTKDNIKAAIRDTLLLRKLEAVMSEQMNDGVDIMNGPDLEFDPFQMMQEMVDKDGGIGGPGLPTPGCDCPHCSTFTPEEHEQARLKAEELGIDFSDPDSPNYGKRKTDIN